MFPPPSYHRFPLSRRWLFSHLTPRSRKRAAMFVLQKLQRSCLVFFRGEAPCTRSVEFIHLIARSVHRTQSADDRSPAHERVCRLQRQNSEHVWSLFSRALPCSKRMFAPPSVLPAAVSSRLLSRPPTRYLPTWRPARSLPRLSLLYARAHQRKRMDGVKTRLLVVCGLVALINLFLFCACSLSLLRVLQAAARDAYSSPRRRLLALDDGTPRRSPSKAVAILGAFRPFTTQKALLSMLTLSAARELRFRVP